MVNFIKFKNNFGVFKRRIKIVNLNEDELFCF